MASALDRIRAATAELHNELDSAAYARAVLDGSLPIARYASFLRAVWLLHGELTQIVERSQDASLRELAGPGLLLRRALLERDLAHLGADLDAVDAASLSALVLAQVMRLAALREPAQLLGHLYVLEGSQLGGLVQAEALAARPELASGGRAYLAGAGKATRAQFGAFVVKLEAALSSEPLIAAAIDGASASFAGFARILGALDPAPERLHDTWLAAQLNEEAGMHTLPEQLREVQAALHAGERSYGEVAYYQARYGERGLRFTRSDSAWLVTLAGDPDATQVLQHVHWLGRLLAARGMPRYLLERHLLGLHEELTRSLPQQAVRYQPLRVAARQLERERLEALPEFSALCGSMPTELQAEAGISPQEAATLLLAAVADEQRGVARAVASLTSWLCDSARFTPRWIQALEALRTRARGDV